CVTMRKPENYSDLFREIFFLHNIPVNISDRFPLEKSPVTVGVFALLDCIAKGFRGSDVQRALESKYLKFYRDENADEEINTINLIQVAQDLRIIGGYARGAHKGWIARLESTIDRIEKEIELMEKYQETEEIDMMVARTQLEKVRLALYDFNIFINSLPLSAGKLRPREFSDFIKNDIIMRHHVAGNIRDYYEQSINRSEIGTNTEFIYYQEDAEKNAHALAALNEAIDEMTFILEDRATADADSGMGNPVSGYSPAFYADRLRTAVSGAKYQIREKQRYGVTVTAIEQTRSIPYKVMILCGALDGEFPLAFRSERFLGKELYGSELRHIQSERLQFYQFLANAPEIINSGSKKIYITFPARENERELVRSSFVDELLKITTLQADGCLADLSGGQIPGGYEFVNTITSRQELLQKYCEFQNIDPENRELRDIAEKTGLGDKIRFIDQARIRKQDAVPEGVILVSKLPEQIAADYSKSTNLAISVSDLDSYAKCPYAYFVEKKLRIKKYEEPELALSPLETGNTLHKIVFRFYSELRESEGGRRINPTELYLPDFILTRLDPDREDEYRERLMEIAREEIERLKFDHPFFGLEEQRIMGTPTTPGYLRSWLSAELRRIRMGWPYTPGLFEFSFGMPSRNHAQSLPPVEFDGFRLRGKIDRIEIDPDTDTPQLLIGDYKTSLGSASSTGSILEGKSFQMPLYLAAAKQFMSDKYHTSIEFGGAAYYPFDPYYDKKNSKFKYEQAVLADDRSKLSMNTGLKKNINISGSRNLVSAEDAVESSIKMAKEIVEDIRAGQFPVDPSGNSCTYCAFGPLCRKKEMGEIEDF
ncbi:MAG: PD-(D/E)XK nuclease family protein, partial [Bacteroidota bacterium]